MFEATDADEHAANLTDWEQQYDQLSGGAFYGRIDEIALDHMQIFKEYTGQAVRQQCNVWPDSLWLGLPVEPEGCRINGKRVCRGDVMCRPGHQDFELVTPAAFNIYGLVIGRDALTRMARTQGVELHDSVWREHALLRIPPEILQATSYLIERLLHSETLAFAAHIQQDIIGMALLELLQKEVPNDALTPAYQHRKRVVDTVKQYIDTHNDAPVTMTELCELTHVSRRTLQYSFETIVGISPLQFLRLTRLNRVRRSLLQPDDDQTVADSATYWGFWHLSQFAKDYKQLFGESPSDTLQKGFSNVRSLREPAQSA